jgi:hypothetical protein
MIESEPQIAVSMLSVLARRLWNTTRS